MYDVIVIGGGSGGLNVAGAAARIGASVALVEKHKLGGECTFTACVPSKALLHAAKLAHETRRAGEFGIRTGTVEVDFPAVMDRVHGVVASFAESDSADVMRGRGIDVYFGSPRFDAYDSILLDGEERLEGHRFVIATGSHPWVPRIPGLAEAGYLDNETVWNLRRLPKSLAVVGGGPVGVELGQAFARFGSTVTIITDGPHLLEREDPAIAALLERQFEAEGIRVEKHARVSEVAMRGSQKVLTAQTPHGASVTVEAEEIFMATGRAPNLDGLGLERVGIRADPRKGIEADPFLQTSAPHIYAIGDVIGRKQFTHAAEQHAAVVVQNALLRFPKKLDDSLVPWATFTDPEVATVGLSLEAAQRSDPAAKVYETELDDVDRVRIDGSPGGLARVVTSPSGRILGASIVGPDASLVIQEFVLAMDRGLTLGHLAGIVHPYPTVNGLVRRLATQALAGRLESPIVRKSLNWFYGFQPR